MASALGPPTSPLFFHLPHTFPNPPTHTSHVALRLQVHPDRCKHPRSADASATVNEAYGTLTNTIKKVGLTEVGLQSQTASQTLQ